MKLIITISFLLATSFSMFCQSTSSMKRELDSLRTVHAVCNIEAQIKSTSNSLDSLIRVKSKLDSQLIDIQSFKIGRTKLEKEKQLKEISVLITNNDAVIEHISDSYRMLLQDLKVAKDNVEKL